MNLSLLKQHLLSLNQKKVLTTPERLAWYKAQKSPAPPPPVPVSIPTPISKTPPPPPQKQAFKLNPKKENPAPDSVSLLNQLKNSIEGVTFFEEPTLPQKKQAILVCSDEERSHLEKLVQAIDSKIMPCSFGNSGEILIGFAGIKDLVYTLPPIQDLNDLAVKQKVWKELKECLSKYC